MFKIIVRIMTVSSIVAVALCAEERANAAGPVLYQDCTIAWNPNFEPDIAGYRVFLGRASGALSQKSEMGYSTQAPCSGIGATTSGQWYVAVSAYDTSGNESSRSGELPFQLADLPSSAPQLTEVPEPTAVQLTVRSPGFQLAWANADMQPVSDRIEMASSLNDWTTVTVLPPGSTRLSYFHPVDVDWVCYRVRGENGVVVSLWAKAGGPEDRQFCFAPTKVPSIAQPVLLPSLIPEPQTVQLIDLHPGFQISWQNWDGSSLWHRIEVSSSINPVWSTLMLLAPDTVEYAFLNPIDADWACFRVRHENNQFVSLWAVAGSPNDRQFCLRPSA